MIRHPNLDRHWNKHKGLVYHWAKKLRTWYGGQREDYLGYLMIRFNNCLNHYDSKAGCRFSTYFSRLIGDGVLRDFLRYESESWAVYVAIRRRRYNDPEKFAAEEHMGVATFNAYEVENYLYRIPPRDDDYLDEVLKLFESRAALWVFLCRGMDWRNREIVEKRYLLGQGLEEIAEAYSVTKQRIEQILGKSLDNIKERLGPIERFQDIYLDPGPLHPVIVPLIPRTPPVELPLKKSRKRRSLAAKRRVAAQRREDELNRLRERAKAIRREIEMSMSNGERGHH